MTFEVRSLPDGRSFALIGELDVAEADRLRSLVRPQADGDVLFDLQELTFLDSSGVFAIASIADELEGGCTLVLCDPTPSVRRVLDLVGIAQAKGPIRIQPPSEPQPR